MGGYEAGCLRLLIPATEGCCDFAACSTYSSLPKGISLKAQSRGVVFGYNIGNFNLFSFNARYEDKYQVLIPYHVLGEFLS